MEVQQTPKQKMRMTARTPVFIGSVTVDRSVVSVSPRVRPMAPTGKINLKNVLAIITLTDNFRFLDHDDTEKVLHDLWHNPPDPNNLGMIFPTDKGPLDRGSWGIVISYEAGGYVKDDDADKINYSDLLKEMQKQIHGL